ncbi:MAG: HdeD family acid-resistance protein, partial [Gammaproteobacteria bacterium]|nr:HdeD family acid-resistance protein [Gammaproteobacteria bacterium]
MNTNTQLDSIFTSQLGEIHEKWGWLLALGIAFILLGTIGLGMTFALTMVSMLFFGFLMLFGGVFQLVQGLGCRGWKSIVIHVLVAIAYLICGVIIITNPLLASEIITMMIAAIFMA